MHSNHVMPPNHRPSDARNNQNHSGRGRIGLAVAGLLSGVLTGGFIAVIGVVFMIVGWSATADADPPDGGIVTTAEVVDSVEGTALINGIVVSHFSPVYQYEDTTGQLHRVTDHISTDSRPPIVGAIVEISYLQGEPESVRRTDVDNDWLRWFISGGAIITAIGATVALLSLTIGVSVIVRRRRHEGSELRT